MNSHISTMTFAKMQSCIGPVNAPLSRGQFIQSQTRPHKLVSETGPLIRHASYNHVMHLVTMVTSMQDH